jgi:hypothetical protein
MNSSLLRKVLLLSVVIPVLGLLVVNSPLSVGQEKAAEKKKEKAKGRLPAYYADVVSDEQKEKIYTIQEKYAKQLKDLNEQLLAVTKKQNDEIEAVLTAEQKEQIDKARAEASAKKKKKAADKKAAEEAPKPAAAATDKPK